jgi:hypothetical protein
MFVSLALFQCMIALAQLGDPREKLSITASVDGATSHNTTTRKRIQQDLHAHV